MKDVLDEINHVCMGKKSNNFSLITDTNAGETMCCRSGHVLNDKLEDIAAAYVTHSTEDYLHTSRVGRK